jgi:hypothetical protein
MLSETDKQSSYASILAAIDIIDPELEELDPQTPYGGYNTGLSGIIHGTLIGMSGGTIC